MGRKEITTKEDLMKVIELSAHLNYNYRTSDGWQLNPYEESKGELVETTKKPVPNRTHRAH